MFWAKIQAHHVLLRILGQRIELQFFNCDLLQSTKQVPEPSSCVSGVYCQKAAMFAGSLGVCWAWKSSPAIIAFLRGLMSDERKGCLYSAECFDFYVLHTKEPQSHVPGIYNAHLPCQTK